MKAPLKTRHDILEDLIEVLASHQTDIVNFSIAHDEEIQNLSRDILELMITKWILNLIQMTGSLHISKTFLENCWKHAIEAKENI